MIAILLGFFASCITVILATRWTEIHRIVIAGIALEFSFVILAAQFASEVGFPLDETLFLMLFLCGSVVAGVLALRIRPRVMVKPVETCILVLVLVSVIAVLRLIFPSDLPSGYGVDAANHYALADSIVQSNKLTGLASWYSQLEPGLQSYPYGYHVTVAFLSKDVGTPLIFVLQPFNEFLVAMVICTVVFLSVSSLKCQKKYIPVIVGLAVGYPYTLDLLAAGYYSQLMGIFLTLSFCLLLTSTIYGESKAWIVLSLVYAAIWLTYPYLALIPSATIFLLIILTQRRRLLWQFAGMLLVSIVLVLPRILWFLNSLTFYLPSTSIALPFYAVLPIGALGVVAIISFVFSARQKRPAFDELIVPCLHIVVIFQTAALYILNSVMNYGSYFFLKAGYLGTFSSIAVAGHLFKANGFSFRSLSHFGKQTIIPFVLLILVFDNFGLAIRADNQIVAEAEIFSLTHPLYDAAIWIDQNVPITMPIQCIASQPLPYWVFAISRHRPLLEPLPSVNQWLSETRKSSILLVAIGPGVPADWLMLENNSSTIAFRILFHESNVFVLGPGA